MPIQQKRPYSLLMTQGLGLLLFGLTTSLLQAAPTQGIEFDYQDWELACDNTRTCRAAGYQADNADKAISVLLTRKAGAKQAVNVEVMLGDYDEQEVALFEQLPDNLPLKLSINGKPLGQVLVNQTELKTTLSTQQTQALLNSLTKHSNIVFSYGKLNWQLSDLGATAVLLKMDEFQGRLGTVGALVNKGNASEANVLPALPIPIVKQVIPVQTTARDNAKDKALFARLQKPLVEALRHNVLANPQTAEYCDMLANPEDHRLYTNIPLHIDLVRLNDTKLLASSDCWLGAYNAGFGYWVVNERPPYQPQLVTLMGNAYNDGEISAMHKGRGLGDCWSLATWTWNGKKFVQTEEATTGMCKLVTPGGPWYLPTLVTKVTQHDIGNTKN